MFTRILVPLDGSPRAEAAIEPAARLARANGGTLVFIEVANIPNEFAPFMDSLALSDVAIDRDLREAESYLAGIAHRVDLQGLATESEVVAGPVAETIIATAARRQIDTIVLASHGRTGVARWVLGSVAQKVVRRSPVPVLVLRDAAPLPAAQSGRGQPVGSLLVPLDGSPFAEEALAPAVALARSVAETGACHIRLLQVVDIPMPHLDPGAITPVAPIDAPTMRTPQDDARTYLEAVAQRVRAMVPATSIISVSIMVLFDVDAAEAIAAAAAGKPDSQGTTMPPSDAIVMTTHGRGGMALWALGSITDRVLSRTTRPLFVVRPAAVTAAQAMIDVEEQRAAAVQPTI